MLSKQYSFLTANFSSPDLHLNISIIFKWKISSFLNLKIKKIYVNLKIIIGKLYSDVFFSFFFSPECFSYTDDFGYSWSEISLQQNRIIDEIENFIFFKFKI